MKRFVFKVGVLLILAVSIIGFIDLRDFVVYDKKDGTEKLEEVNYKNKSSLKTVEDKVKNLLEGEE
ncbi:hypothetical protein [Anaerosphaera multitolerans]|nr:hypothetical protein [Anaerosphaera multitolerans]